MKKYFGIAAMMMMMMMLFASIAIAQHTSTQERTKGQSSTHVMVRSGKVIATEGNNLIIQMQDGKVEHLTVPADAKFTVDGKEVGITDLKPGTELSQSVITTTTPTTLRTTTTISGRVFAVNPPTSVILTLAGGENRRYYIPEGQKINVGGQELDAFALKPGMRINAKVTQEVPEEDVEVRRGEVVGMAPPEPTPAPAEPTTTAQSTAPTAPAQPAEESTPAADKNEALPQTASNLPLLGLIGALLMLLGYKTLYRRT